DLAGGVPAVSGGISFKGGPTPVPGGPGQGTNTIAVVSAGTIDVSYVPDQVDPRLASLPSDGTLRLGGATVHFSGMAFVRGVAPVINNVSIDKTTVTEGQSVTVKGAFTDAGFLAHHTVIIQWGEGFSATPLAVGARSFSITDRVLGEGNPLRPTISVLDD